VNFPLPPQCPYYLITRAALSTTSLLKKTLSNKGAGNIKPAYLAVLIPLWSQNNLRANELGKKAGLEPSTMTGLLDRMEKAGLVKRSPDPEDRRANRISLTENGSKMEKISETAVKAMFDTAFVNMSKNDINITKKTLGKIIENCKKGDA